MVSELAGSVGAGRRPRDLVAVVPGRGVLGVSPPVPTPKRARPERRKRVRSFGPTGSNG